MKKILYYCGFCWGFTTGVIQNVLLKSIQIVDNCCCNKECVNGCASGYEYVVCDCGCGMLKLK